MSHSQCISTYVHAHMHIVDMFEEAWSKMRRVIMCRYWHSSVVSHHVFVDRVSNLVHVKISVEMINVQ